jgi:hypothetical protein
LPGGDGPTERLAIKHILALGYRPLAEVAAADKAQYAADILRARDFLNRLAYPAKGMTVA